MITCDVTVIGAGPYGMSAAHQLRHLDGLDVRVFGKAMSFWENAMPRGMFLRSNWTATEIADPDGRLTLERFKAECGNHLTTPVPLDRFVEYGKWYQRNSIPDLDQRRVTLVETGPKGFIVTLEDGERFASRRVVVAVGIQAFARRPPEFAALPPSLVSHTSDHSDLSVFAGKDLLVVGSGQSALESSALLRENRANVAVVSHSQQIHWLGGLASRALHHHLGTITSRLLYAPTDVGPAGVSQLMARPDLLRRLPRALQDKLRARSIRPAGARWLVERLREIPIRLQCPIRSVTPSGERVRVELGDGTEMTVDHILLGTGYRIDVTRYSFLSPALLEQIEVFNGFPILKRGLESSVPGLHFLGAPGSWSFGPLMMFVSGTHYAGRALSSSIAGQLSHRRAYSRGA